MQGVVVNRALSDNRTRGHQDYYDVVTTYVNVLSNRPGLLMIQSMPAVPCDDG